MAAAQSPLDSQAATFSQTPGAAAWAVPAVRTGIAAPTAVTPATLASAPPLVGVGGLR